MRARYLAHGRDRKARRREHDRERHTFERANELADRALLARRIERRSHARRGAHEELARIFGGQRLDRNRDLAIDAQCFARRHEHAHFARPRFAQIPSDAVDCAFCAVEHEQTFTDRVAERTRGAETNVVESFCAREVARDRALLARAISECDRALADSRRAVERDDCRAA